MADAFSTILTDHSFYDIGLATIAINYGRGEPSLTVLLTEYDENALEDPRLARYEVDCLPLRDDLSPLTRTDLRPTIDETGHG
jgi:hypothetical protein